MLDFVLPTVLAMTTGFHVRDGFCSISNWLYHYGLGVNKCLNRCLRNPNCLALNLYTAGDYRGSCSLNFIDCLYTTTPTGQYKVKTFTRLGKFPVVELHIH